MGKPLGTGAKVAIGCAILLFVAGIATVVILGGAMWWGKSKLDQVKGEVDKYTGDQARIEELQKKANANVFEEPADGVIAEPRLLTFLQIRKRVYDVYKKHEPEIEARRQKKQGDLSDVTALMGLVNEIRGVQAQAQADLGMSDAEYHFMVRQIYASSFVQQGSSPTATPAPGEPTPAPGEATPAPGDTTPTLHSDVPAQNLALFQKHEADIKKYAMTGMEFLGL